ncbi:ricin-type beta-trefoil lectin domain protein [Streptomyces bathyalis]|nr:ricin-type beta-trefoil lectin domain protein [Streptomyces bathyalis]
MTGSRDEHRPQGDSESQDPAFSADAAEETFASSRDQEDRQRSDAPENPTGRADEDENEGTGNAGGIVTVVNPRIVPAGSRNPAPAPPPPGRTRLAVIAAAAAIALTGLAGGSYLLVGGDAGEGDSRAGAGQGWQGGQNDDDFGHDPLPGDSSSGRGDGKDNDPGKDGSPGSGAHGGPQDDGDKGKDRPPKEDDGDGADEDPPPEEPGGGNGSDGTVRIWNHNSDLCINVPEGQARDGMYLEIRTCSGADSMRWTFADDGTVRALGLCMDVANGSTENGAVIQLANCSGNPAQQFRLNERSDLVNPQADKCVAVRDGDVRVGQHLQLWDCSGQDSQKWSAI